jgi:hypothetical protein
MTLDLLTEIYSSFEPFQPPPKEAYVDCQEVRGGWEVVRELGRKIARSKKPTCQLYSGHRGVGKSTELLRLKEYLEQQKYFEPLLALKRRGIRPGIRVSFSLINSYLANRFWLHAELL